MNGSCHCGAVRYAIDGKVLRFAFCHCDDCRKISGSPFGAALVVDAAGFRITQGEHQLTAYQSSPGKDRCFCKQCGTHLFARMASKPEIRIVRAGSLDTPPAVPPQMHIWTKVKAPWCTIGDALPQFTEGFVPAAK